MKRLKIIVCLIFLFVFALKGQVPKTDSLQGKEPKLLEFIQVIVIGNLGCNIYTGTSLTNEGQTKEYRIPFPKKVTIENLDCENCKIDTTEKEYNLLNVFSKNVKFGVVTNCTSDGLLKIAPDSVFTISNIDHSYDTPDELKNVEGFGGTERFSAISLIVSLSPLFEFISMNENIPGTSFEITKENQIELRADNVGNYVFEIKYRRRNSKTKILSNVSNIKAGVAKMPFIPDPRYSNSSGRQFKVHEQIKQDVSSTHRAPYPTEVDLPRHKMKN